MTTFTLHSYVIFSPKSYACFCVCVGAMRTPPLSSQGYSSENRVGNFRQKNNSAEDGIHGTNGYFRRNSGCSAEQKCSEFRSEPFRGRENNSEFRSVDQKQKQMLGIPFRTLQQKRKQPGIPFRITEIEANSRNSLHRKRKQLVIPFRGTTIEANSRNSVPNHSGEEKTTRNKTRQRQSLTLFKLRVLVEALRLGRDVAECG